MPQQYQVPPGKPNDGRDFTIPADPDVPDLVKIFQDYSDTLPLTPLIVTSDTAPTPAVDGMLWFDSSVARLMVYYNTVWVDVTGTNTAKAGLVVVELTAAQYAALPVKDPNVLYVVDN